MKVVFITNRVKKFALSYRIIINLLLELGHEVIWAADFTTFEGDLSVIPCEIYQTNFKSNPLNLSNIKAYRQLISLFKCRNIDAIHCNTPIGGLLGRVCAKKAKIRKVIYTAHGFHFYRGAPILNRSLFRLGEKILAHYTDVLITINEEDYQAAKGFKLRRGGKLYKIPGAGIETGYNCTVDNTNKRHAIGIPTNAIMLVSAGELNKNKNNEIIIRALAQINNSNIYYVLCGEGVKRKKLEKLAINLGISNNIVFLGFRTDVLDIINCADIFVMTSFREGLPRSLMEAMDAGLPCIVSAIRGNIDLIEQEKGGFLYKPNDKEGFAIAIEKLVNDKRLRDMYGKFNREKVKQYDYKNVIEEMRRIYQKHLI